MKSKNLILLIVLPLTGCGLFSPIYYDSSAGAYDIAQHNYNQLLSSQDSRKSYLLVDKDGNTTPKNIFIYINSLREPLEKYKIMTQNLIQYNKDIMSRIKEQNAH